jgi:hypothetical protein
MEKKKPYVGNEIVGMGALNWFEEFPFVSNLKDIGS